MGPIGKEWNSEQGSGRTYGRPHGEAGVWDLLLEEFKVEISHHSQKLRGRPAKLGVELGVRCSYHPGQE